MVRVFIAVDVDEPPLVSRISQFKRLLVSTGVPMKPVEDANLHITLRFIGEVSEGLVEELKRVLGGVRFESFRMVLRGVGAFPSLARPRVVWIGVGEGSEELSRIRGEIERGLRALGLRPEKEEFVPHLTLARVKGRRNIERLVRLLGEYRDFEVGEMVVSSVRLKQSILTPRGPIYRTLYEVEASE